MKKIQDTVLLQLHAEGVEQKEIACRLGVSPAAVCKRLKRLQQIAARPAILDKLTEKEERFVMEMASGKNQTQAAVAAFNVSSLDSAKTIGCRLAKDADIQEAITAVMVQEGLDRRYLVKRLRQHVDNEVDGIISLRAVDMGLKLHDAYPAGKSMNMNVNANLDLCPVDLSKFLNR